MSKQGVNDTERSFTVSGEILEVGDGHITITHDGLMMHIPSDEDAQRWAAAHMYEDVEVALKVKVKAA